MNIMTEHGITIGCLPDNARCKVYNENPEKMNRCPIYNFDDFGEYCVPDLCDMYTEEVSDEDR